MDWETQWLAMRRDLLERGWRRLQEAQAAGLDAGVLKARRARYLDHTSPPHPLI